jgi:hypothetical protein
MFCVQASNITMPWNGSRLPGFTPTRGLRQGDPMYPYPFVLCMEKLACLIGRKKVQDKSWKPIHVSKGGGQGFLTCFLPMAFYFCQGKEFSSEVNAVCSECVL